MYQALGFKILTRWYLMPTHLGKMLLLNSNLWRRCGKAVRDMVHVSWSCEKVPPYWIGVLQIIQKFTDQQLQLDPTLFLSRLYPKYILQKSYTPLIN